MTCSCKKPSAPPSAAVAPRPAFRLPGTAQLRPGIVRTDGVAPHLSPQLRDMDGTPLPDLDPSDPGAGPPIREPVDASSGAAYVPASTTSSNGVVVFTDPAQVSAYNSPLGQALEKLAHIFNGTTS